MASVSTNIPSQMTDEDIKKMVDFYKKHHASKGKKKDCGCKNRQEKLNKIFPYKNSKNEDV